MPGTVQEAQQSKCVVQTCCCCVDLRTGCLILGSLSLIGVIYYTCITVLLAVSLSPWFALATVFCLIIMVMNCLFIHGVRNDILKYVRIWIGFCIVSTILAVVQGISRAAAGQAEELIEVVVALAFNIYYIIVINSYIEVLKEKEKSCAQIEAMEGATATGMHGLPGSEEKSSNNPQVLDPSQLKTDPNQGPNTQMYPSFQQPPTMQQYPYYPPQNYPPKEMMYNSQAPYTQTGNTMYPQAGNIAPPPYDGIST